MLQAPRHKVFISYHDTDEDREYKGRFVTMMRDYIVDHSVHDDDIDDRNLLVDEIRRRIRDNFIADATVTVVLIGPCIWQRKHVDWEIGSSLADTDHNVRCGLLGLLLPNHPSFRLERFDPHQIPPRLAANCGGENPYAKICRWSGSPHEASRIRGWIDEAFRRRNQYPRPNNTLPQFRNNRRGDCQRGWQG